MSVHAGLRRCPVCRLTFRPASRSQVCCRSACRDRYEAWGPIDRGWSERTTFVPALPKEEGL